MAVNTVSERSITALRPRASAITWTYTPAVLPSTVAIAVRRPKATPRPITKSTLGPGMTTSTNATAVNAASLPGSISLRYTAARDHLRTGEPKPAVLGPVGRQACLEGSGHPLLLGVRERRFETREVADACA